MNLAYNRYQDNLRDQEQDDAGGFERDSKSRENQNRQRKSRRNNYAQKSRPAVHSGMHRRRNKRFGL